MKCISTRNVVLGFLLNLNVGSFSSTHAQTVSIDIRDYITVTASNNMLCDANPQGKLCIRGYWNQFGEFSYEYYNQANQNRISDHITRSGSSPYYVGVARNFAGADENNAYRCFANLGGACSAISDTLYTIQSVPMIFAVNIVSAQTEASTLNNSGSLDDGSVKRLIPGSVPLIQGGYQAFSVNAINPKTCVQTPAGNIAHQVYASYVTQVDFGGNLGTRDALVIDEEQGGLFNGQFYPEHIERFYYVLNIGRVKDSSAGYTFTDAGGVNNYSRPLGHTSNRSNIMPPNFSLPEVFCPQGSAPFN